jgi:hypothetical protein
MASISDLVKMWFLVLHIFINLTTVQPVAFGAQRSLIPMTAFKQIGWKVWGYSKPSLTLLKLQLNIQCFYDSRAGDRTRGLFSWFSFILSHFTEELQRLPMEQRALKNISNCLYTNIYSYLETSGGKSYNPYLNVVHIFNTRVN